MTGLQPGNIGEFVENFFLEASLENPRTEYTFFPYLDEVKMITNADTDEIIETCLQIQPEMAGRYMHELWRTGRYNVIYEIRKQITDDENLIAFLKGLWEELPPCYMVAIASGENLKNYETYIEELFTIIINSSNDLPYNSVPAEEASIAILGLRDRITNTRVNYC